MSWAILLGTGGFLLGKYGKTGVRPLEGALVGLASGLVLDNVAVPGPRFLAGAPSSRKVFLDNNSTTPTDPVVVEAMLPYFSEKYGNPASRHVWGTEAKAAVDQARSWVARAIGASPSEIIFTSGATESDNLAIRGVAYDHGQGHIVTTNIEHKAVLDTCRSLEREGFQVTYVPVEPNGIVDPGRFVNAFRSNTILASVMLANNEVGTVQPIDTIGIECRKHGVLFHTDAVQGVGKVPFNVRNVDLASLSAHKMYGPKGIGALYVRKGVELQPLFTGGGQEGGVRPGTLPVPLVVGMGTACAGLLVDDLQATRALRDRLLSGLLPLGGVRINGDLEQRLPGNLNVSFEGVNGSGLVFPEIAVSSGSACSSQPVSYVLKALGLSDSLARASLRFGLGRFTTQDDVDFAIDVVSRKVRQLRGGSG